MASKSDQTSPSDKSLSKSDLGTLHSTLYPVRNRYKPLGLQIGVEIDEIESIEAQYTNPSDRLLAILSVRLDQANPLTWSDIDTALRLGVVGKGKLADKIRRKYGHQFSPQHSSEEEVSQRKKHKKYSRKLDSDSYSENEEREPISKGKRVKEKAIQGELTQRERKKKGKATEVSSKQSKYQHFDEQSYDQKARKKPAQISKRLKEAKSESESYEYETCVSASEDETDKVTSHKLTQIKGERKAKSAKEKYSPSPSKKQHSKNSKTNVKQKELGKEKKYVKANSKSQKESRTKWGKEKAKKLSYKHSSEDSEESDSDDSSEDEEDRDSEQKLSNEEEETEPDDESSSDTSEEEVKKTILKSKIAVLSSKERRKTHKETERKNKGKKLKIATDVQYLLRDQSDPGGRGRDQEEQDIQPKKRSRRRHRESSMSPTTRGSSSPSTSQEGKPVSKGKEKHQRRKTKRVHREEGSASSTDTDDSSPDCDVLKNVSETQRKCLRKVFKRFFGRLCFVIKNPVELATILQMKGLLTYSVMNDLLTSPESTQAKSITLVRALQKQVKSHPDKMFIIIEVFLHNEVMQQTGREMWREIGNNVFN